MAKCLNCGKEVKNKFCNVSCQNEYKGKLNKQKYEENPCTCAKCGNPLPWEKRRNKYCSSSCAAKVNNIGIDRHYRDRLVKIKNEGFNEKVKTQKLKSDKIIEKFKDTIKVYKCSDKEFINLILNFTTWKDLYTSLGYSQGRSERKDCILQRCKELGLDPPSDEISLSERTKGYLFLNGKNWQSARSNIRRHAQNIFTRSGLEQKCLLCGYDKHIEVAHIKPVSDFDDNVTIAEINDLRNLIPLCPNHHWEFDHNCLSEENLKKINDYCNKL